MKTLNYKKLTWEIIKATLAFCMYFMIGVAANIVVTHFIDFIATH